MKCKTPPEKIFSRVADIIMRARARAKASVALAQDLKNEAVEDIQYADFSRREVKKHGNQASISY